MNDEQARLRRAMNILAGLRLRLAALNETLDNIEASKKPH